MSKPPKNWEDKISSQYDIEGIKFGFATLSINSEFEINFPIKYKDVLLEQKNYIGDYPLITFRYETGIRFIKTKFMWAGETETLDPDLVAKYVGFCRIQNNIQHLIILK